MEGKVEVGNEKRKRETLRGAKKKSERDVTGFLTQQHTQLPFSMRGRGRDGEK